MLSKENWAQIQWILWEGPKSHMRLTATGCSANQRESTSFCSWLRSVRNSAITRWNACDSIIHVNGKRRNSTIGQKWEVNYLYNGQLSTPRCIKTVIIFEQHIVFNIENNGSVELFHKIGTIIRSNKDSKWQACTRETDADREQWTSKRDEQGSANAKHSCLVAALDS